MRPSGHCGITTTPGALPAIDWEGGLYAVSLGDHLEAFGGLQKQRNP